MGDLSAKKIGLGFWLAIAVLIRAISAWTHATYAHPDEWFKTVEIAQYLVRGTASYCQEIALHYVNLLWPFLLTIPLSFAHLVSPDSIHFRVFSFQFFTGLLDLGIVWSWWSLLEEMGVETKARNWAIILLLFPWFLVHDSIRPTAEHLSAIAFWVSLGFFSRRKFFSAGLFAVMIAAFRYPAAWLSMGIFLGFFLNPEVRKTYAKNLLAGSITGLILGGLPDWIVYGRPWESFWMFLQYNIFTGLSHTKFGAQPPTIYWSFVSGRWFNWIFFFGLSLLGFGFLGLKRGLKQKSAWAYAFALFLGAHLLIAHKEPRFVAPLEIIFLWAALIGFWGFAREKPRFVSSRAFKWVLSITLIANSVLFAKALWGETWRLSQNYLELPALLKKYSDVCAVITPKRMTSVMYASRGDLLPTPPLGVSPYENSKQSFAQATHLPIIWIDHPETCTSEQSVLIQAWSGDPKWVEAGCKLLESGVLHVLPENRWAEAVSKPGLVAGPWYRCPAPVLKTFAREITEPTLFHQIVHIETLPSLSASADEILRFDRNQSPDPDCKWFCPGSSD